MVRVGSLASKPHSGHHAPLSMVSNSFSSPVMRGMRVHGMLVLVATAYTWESGARHGRAGGHTQRVPGPKRTGSDLGLHVVSHVVGSAAQGNLPDRPRGIVGQVGRQDTDPQLTLVRGGQGPVRPGIRQGQGRQTRASKGSVRPALSSTGTGVCKGLRRAVPCFTAFPSLLSGSPRAGMLATDMVWAQRKLEAAGEKLPTH